MRAPAVQLRRPPTPTPVPALPSRRSRTAAPTLRWAAAPPPGGAASAGSARFGGSCWPSRWPRLGWPSGAFSNRSSSPSTRSATFGTSWTMRRSVWRAPSPPCSPWRVPRPSSQTRPPYWPQTPRVSAGAGQRGRCSARRRARAAEAGQGRAGPRADLPPQSKPACPPAAAVVTTALEAAGVPNAAAVAGLLGQAPDYVGKAPAALQDAVVFLQDNVNQVGCAVPCCAVRCSAVRWGLAAPRCALLDPACSLRPQSIGRACSPRRAPLAPCHLFLPCPAAHLPLPCPALPADHHRPEGPV